MQNKQQTIPNSKLLKPSKNIQTRQTLIASTCTFLCMVGGAHAANIEYTNTQGMLQAAPSFTPSWSSNILYPGDASNPIGSGNTITINYNDPLKSNPDFVFGGLSEDKGSGAESKNNIVEIIHGKVEYYVYGGYGRGTTVTVSGNNVGMSGGSASGVYGGFGTDSGSSTSTNFAITDNHVSMTGSSSVANFVYGGYNMNVGSDSVNIITNNNTVHMSDDSSAGSIVGGSSHGTSFNPNSNMNVTSNGNSVSMDGNSMAGGMTGSDVSVDSYSGGNMHVTSNGNSINMAGNSSNTSIYGSIYGSFISVMSMGSSPGNTDITGNNNTVNMDEHSSVSSSVVGSYVQSTSSDNVNITLNDNVVSMHGSSAIIGDVSAARGLVDVRGLGSGNFSVSGNTVHLDENSTVGGAVYGGFAYAYTDNSSTANTGITVSGNTVNMDGHSSVNGDIYGGYSSVDNGGSGHMDLQITDNTVNIAGNASLASTSSIYGGYLDPTSNYSGGILTVNVFSGNTLNFSAQPISLTNMGNFEYYNFTIPASAVNGTTLISASGTVDVDRSKVEVKGIAPGSPLMAGDSVILIDAQSLIGTATTIDSQVSQGISLIYDVEVRQNSNQITATIVSVENISGGGTGNPWLPARVNPQTKALSEGRLSGLAFSTQGADLVAQQAITNALTRTSQEEGRLVSFGTLAGSSNRYKSGSHVDVKGFSMLAGAAYKQNDWVIAGFIEGGSGNYDSYNSFINATSVHGEGNTKYYGAGLLGRYDFNNGVYLDGSIRAGKTDTDFKSNNLVSAQGVMAHYDSKSTYYGAHIGAGYAWDLAPQTQLDVSAKYLWTHQTGDNVIVAGDPIHFDSANSHRVRLNGQIHHNLSPQVTLTGGLGYEYEFDGKVNATTYYAYHIDAPSLKGGSGIGEVGLTFRPTNNNRLSLQANLRGYVGQREGVEGTVHIMYAF